MIKAFGAKNFCSFKEGLEVDFTLNDKVPAEDRERGNISHVMGIKGANGSGKTSILKALMFISDFISNDWKLDVEASIPYRPFFDSKDSSNFYICLDISGSEYNYSFELLGDKVVTEELRVTPYEGKEQVIFLRTGDTLDSCSDHMVEFKSIILSSNASLVGLLPKYKFSEDMPELTSFFDAARAFLGNVGETGYVEVDYDAFSLSSQYLQSPEAFELLKKIIKISDSNIKDVVINEHIKSDGEVQYYPTFTHESGGKNHFLGLGLESSGTQAIFKRMYLYWAVLSGGGILIYDELDIHLHALILPEVIGLFTNAKTNPHNAQLIFTAHNTEVLETLGRYRAVLVEKEENESYCYRLDELKGSALRNGRPITPLYLKGKLGGVPKIA